MKKALVILLITSSMCYAQAPEKKPNTLVAASQVCTKKVMNQGLLFEVKYDPLIGNYISIKADTATCKIKPSASNSSVKIKNDEGSK
jgi:hypothetical protein